MGAGSAVGGRNGAALGPRGFSGEDGVGFGVRLFPLAFLTLPVGAAVAPQ